MNGFPVYDYPITGDVPPEEFNAEEPNVDSSLGLFKSYNTVPVPEKPTETSSFIGDFTTAIGAGLSFPFKAVGGAASTVVDKVSSTVKSTYFYLIGGIAIIGILAIVLLGAGSRFMGKLEGGK